LILALWNYCDPEAEGEGKSFRIQLADPDAYKREATIQVVDETHGNAVRRWNLMGGPQFPTREQISELQTAAMVPAQETISLEDVINLKPHALESLKGKRCCRQVKFYSGVSPLTSRWSCLSRILARRLNRAVLHP
jgi:hypothetical protein